MAVSSTIQSYKALNTQGSASGEPSRAFFEYGRSYIGGTNAVPPDAFRFDDMPAARFAVRKFLSFL